MDPGRDHLAVDGHQHLEGGRGVAGHHFHDVRQAPLLVARVDAFGRVADEEVLLPAPARGALEFGHADLLGRAGVDGALVADDRAALQVGSDRAAGRHQRTEVGLVRLIHRRGDGHDHDVGARDLGRIGRERETRRVGEVLGGALAGHVDLAVQLVDAPLRDVEPDGVEVPAELEREWQADITEADHGKGGGHGKLRTMGAGEAGNAGLQAQGRKHDKPRTIES